jgi:hypothetical protein
MDAMEAQLRENYEGQDTEELLELLARDSLTDTARRVLNEVLSRRGVSENRIEQIKSEVAVTERESKRIDINQVEKYWRVVRYSFTGLVAMVVIAFYSHTVAPQTDGIVGFLIVACGLTYCVAVGYLARALKRSVVAWVLLVIFVPLGIGKLIALFRLTNIVAAARQDAILNP